MIVDKYLDGFAHKKIDIFLSKDDTVIASVPAAPVWHLVQSKYELIQREIWTIQDIPYRHHPGLLL